MGINIQHLLQHASFSLSDAKAVAQKYLVSIGANPNKNACAATLSALFKGVDSDFPMIAGAQQLADYLAINKGWEKIDYKISEILPGDVGVCIDAGQGAAGADHIYLVINAQFGSDIISIVDNQGDGIHGRSVSGVNKTPTDYFLRQS